MNKYINTNPEHHVHPPGNSFHHPFVRNEFPVPGCEVGQNRKMREEREELVSLWLSPPPLRQDETEASHCMQRTEVCASKLCLPAVQQHNEKGLGSRTHGDFPEFYSLFLISFPVLLITPFQLLCGDTDRQQVLFNQTRSSFKKLYITKFLSGWKEKKKKSSQGVSYFYTPRENLVKTQV